MNKIQSISIEDFEFSIFSEIQELHQNKELSETDSLVLNFCEFIELKSIGDHIRYSAPPFLGKRALFSNNKTQKEDFVYFYQHSEGINVFMHPLDFEYLVKEIGGVSKLAFKLNTKVSKCEKVIQNSFYRKFWTQFSQVNLDHDFDLVQITLNELVSNFDLSNYSSDLANLALGILESQKAQTKSTEKREIVKLHDDKDRQFDEYDYNHVSYDFEAIQDLIMDRHRPFKSTNGKRSGTGNNKKKSLSDAHQQSTNFNEQTELQILIDRINVGQYITVNSVDMLHSTESHEHKPCNVETTTSVNRVADSEENSVQTSPLIHAQPFMVADNVHEQNSEPEALPINIRKVTKKRKEKYPSKKTA